MLLRIHYLFLSGIFSNFTQIRIDLTIRLSMSYFKRMFKFGGTNSYLNLRMDSQDAQTQLCQNVVKDKCLLQKLPIWRKKMGGKE